jgi:type III secretory pathway component EscS
MLETTIITYLYDVLFATAVLALPPLLIATIVAFLVGLFQAVTQIQEQTLPQTIKMFVIGFILLSFGASLMAPLYTVSDRIFSNFHNLV